MAADIAPDAFLVEVGCSFSGAYAAYRVSSTNGMAIRSNVDFTLDSV
jgi:hypothetical protein